MSLQMQHPNSYTLLFRVFMFSYLIYLSLVPPYVSNSFVLHLLDLY